MNCPSLRPTWAQIDLTAFQRNLRTVMRLIPQATGILAIVKADAYGLGAVEVSRVATKNKQVWGLGVATPDEALHLRENGIDEFILVLGSSTQEAASALASRGVALTVGSIPDLKAADRGAACAGNKLKVHLKVDTGMNRIGFQVGEPLSEALRHFGCSRNLVLDGVFTHLSSADTDAAYTTEQISRFKIAKSQIEMLGIHPRCYHAANSAAIYLFPDAHMDMVRPGIMLYGSYPAAHLENLGSIEPVMSLYSTVSNVKRVTANTSIGYGGTYTTQCETTIATVPLGYADGYPRLLSNSACVLIKGKRHPLAGRVCMDQLMVDVGDASVQKGDLVTLMGKDGGEFIGVDELAEKSATIAHEILTGISGRVPRVYK